MCRFWRGGLLRGALLLLLGAVGAEAAPLPVPYDLIYVRAPRLDDTTPMRWAEVFSPIYFEPGTDLMLLRQDGTEEVLVSGGADGAVFDPLVSFDAQWVYYAHIPNVRVLDKDRGSRGTPKAGSDLYKIHVITREVRQLTHGEWTPTTGIANWVASEAVALPPPPGQHALGYGVFNTAPCQLPGHKLMFTSSRNGLQQAKGYTFPLFQLFVLDELTGVVELVGALNLGSALHPVVLMDGRVMFSTGESAILHDPRMWGLWAIHPDGTNWEPLLSAFVPPMAAHWQTQLSSGQPAVVVYYNSNNGGFGTLWAMANFPPGLPMAPTIPRFGSPVPNDVSNPKLPMGYRVDGTIEPWAVAFSPVGLRSLTPFAHPFDRDASRAPNDYWYGKVTQPSAAPHGDVLLVWSDGPVHLRTHPQPDAGIYLLVRDSPAYTPTDFVRLTNHPLYNEQQPKALVAYQAVYGIDAPAALPWVPNDGALTADLPQGTPFALVGTSSFYKRNTAPGLPSGNWSKQGADAGPYTSAEIEAVRLLLQEPNSHISYGTGSNHGGQKTWTNAASERLKILGEIRLRKFQPDGTVILDPDGNPDTSFLAKIPADMVFTFQTLDAQGRALNTSQTWHQLRPGERRTDCGGCHAHSQIGTDFSRTVAGQPGFPLADLTVKTPFTVEYTDVLPVLAARCPLCTGITYNQLLTPTWTKPFQSRISPLLEQLPMATPEERRMIATWIDLGLPRSLRPQALLQDTTPWRESNTRPTVTLHLRQTPQVCALGCAPTAPSTQLSVGMFAYAGIASWTLTSPMALAGAPPGTNLASQCVAEPENPGVCLVPLSGTGQAVLTVTVIDRTGVTAVKQLAASW